MSRCKAKSSIKTGTCRGDGLIIVIAEQATHSCEISSSWTDDYDGHFHAEGSVLITRKLRLSGMDRKVLKILLAPNGESGLHVAASPLSNGLIADKLGIPLASIKRRRIHLEKHFIELRYFMNLGILDHRRVDFLISTQRGLAGSIAKKLLKIREVVSVSHSIGQPTIDLRAETIVRDNGQLLDLLEQAKAIDGVREVVWSEIVKVAGDKGSVPPDILEII